MAAYSLDLRERIVEAVERQIGSKRKIAELFGVHESVIYKLLRQRRERGDIAPLPHGGGAHAKLSADHLRQLPDLVAATPDATLDELREQMKKKARIAVSLSTLGRGLQALGLSRKKKSTLAAQADPTERAVFQAEQKTLVMEDLIFLDEFGINLAMTRTHARAQLGARVTVTEPFHPGGNLSVSSALGLHGVCAPLTIEGAVNSEVFEVYVKHLLVPCLRPGNLVLLDNVQFHYTPKAIELIEAAGARVLHLPAYSPDFNPIEGCIAKLKTALRSFKARTKRKLTNALARAMALVTEDDIRGWFEHCGYVFSLK